jgi:hypothetical protein
MVADNDIKARIGCLLESVERLGAATTVTASSRRGASIRLSCARWAMPSISRSGMQTIGSQFNRLQQDRQQCRRGRAVDVIVTENGDVRRPSPHPPNRAAACPVA